MFSVSYLEHHTSHFHKFHANWTAASPLPCFSSTQSSQHLSIYTRTLHLSHLYAPISWLIVSPTHCFCLGTSTDLIIYNTLPTAKASALRRKPLTNKMSSDSSKESDSSSNLFSVGSVGTPVSVQLSQSPLEDHDIAEHAQKKKTRQTRNKPTLSCAECVERKTKVRTKLPALTPILLVLFLFVIHNLLR